MLRSLVIKKSFLVFLVIIFSLVSFLTVTYFDLIIGTFGPQEVSNSTKIEQHHEIMKDITFFGNGLGSSLSSGYSRDIAGYGFELTYQNILHKLGVFSAFLFMSYALTLSLSLLRIIKRKRLFDALFVLGGLGYLIVGIGNPVLLANICVVFHCMIMYMLVYPYFKIRAS